MPRNQKKRIDQINKLITDSEVAIFDAILDVEQDVEYLDGQVKGVKANIEDIYSEIDNVRKQPGPKGDPGQPGANAKPLNEEKIIARVASKVSNMIRVPSVDIEAIIDEIKSDIPKPTQVPADTPTQIAEKLNTLEAAVDWKVIKNAPRFKDRARDGYPYGLPQPAASLTYQLGGAQVGRGNIINLVAGTNVTIDAVPSGDKMTYTINSTGGAGGVTSLNTLTGAVTLSAGTGIALNVVGNDIEIENTAPGFATLTDPLEVWYTNALGTAPTSDAEFTRNPATGEFTAQRTTGAFITQGFYLTDVGGSVPSSVIEYADGLQFTRLMAGSDGAIIDEYSEYSSAQLRLLDYSSSATTRNAYLFTNLPPAPTTATDNIFAGSGASALTSGSFNTSVGFSAGDSITTGSTNTVYGSLAGTGITTGSSNTLVGESAGAAITTVSGITAVGYMAGASNTTGTGNTFIGRAAGDSVTTAQFVTAIGDGAAGAITIINPAATEMLITAVGYNALAAATHYRNTALGARAGEAITGASAFANVFIGDESGKAMTTGAHNVFVGGQSGWTKTSGDDNTMVGFAPNIQGTGNSNTAVGANALYANTTGNANIGIGVGTGLSNAQEGDFNILIGFEADVTNATDANNIVFGHQTQSVGSNTINFGSDGQPYFHGYIGQGRWSPGNVSTNGFVLHGTSAGFSGGGGADANGYYLKIAGGASTGVGIPADTGFMTSRKDPTVASDDENVDGDRYTALGNYVEIPDNTDTAVVKITVADTSTNGASVGGKIIYTIRAKDGAGAIETHHNELNFVIENVGGTVNPVITVNATPTETGTWTVTPTLVDDGLGQGGVDFMLQADNSLNEPNLVNVTVITNFAEALISSL